MLSDARIVCITGMHCSGTSATARILNLLGVDLGPPEVGSPARRANTRGLWEHPQLTRIGERALRTLGGSWDAPPTLRDGWYESPELDVHGAAALRIAESAFGRSRLWGWKDPRSSLLLPFWERLLGPLHVVICVRSPNDVASSLQRRDGMDRDRALALWARYTRALESVIGPRPTLVSCYEDLWRGSDAFARLAAFVNRPEADQTREFRAAATEWLDESLWSNRAGADPDTAVAGLPPDMRALHERMLRHSV